MKNYLEAAYPLRACDFDPFRCLQPASVLDLFQDVAGRHSVELGVGIAQLMPQNKLWIVSTIYYEVVNTPEMYSTVTLGTWPLAPSMVVFPRDYLMKNSDGTILVKGTSQWALIDKENRKVLPAKGVYPQELACYENRAFEGKIPRLRDFEPQGEGMVVTPTFSQLDCNGHVNNTKYANYVLDALQLNGDNPIKTFCIHYRKELLLGVPVTLYTKEEKGTYDVMGKNEQGETMFNCQITLKK